MDDRMPASQTAAVARERLHRAQRRTACGLTYLLGCPQFDPHMSESSTAAQQTGDREDGLRAEARRPDAVAARVLHRRSRLPDAVVAQIHAARHPSPLGHVSEGISSTVIARDSEA